MMASCHCADSDTCFFFQLLKPTLTPVSLLESEAGWHLPINLRSPENDHSRIYSVYLSIVCIYAKGHYQSRSIALRTSDRNISIQLLCTHTVPEN